MSKIKKLFQQLVFFTGLLNFPIGLGMIIVGLYTQNPDTITITIVLGAFIINAGAMLMWASKNLQTRAPLVVWNGLVRSIGFIGVAYTVIIGISPMLFVIIGGMDFMLAFIYIIGSSKYTGIPISKLLLGKV